MIEYHCIVFLLLLIIGEYLYVHYKNLLMELRDVHFNEILKWHSRENAGGHGMVITDNGVENAVSPEECNKRAKAAEELSDTKLKAIALFKTFFPVIVLYIIGLCITTAILFYNS